MENLILRGFFVILNLTAGFLVDFLSGSVLQLLWNNVFNSVALVLIYSVSLATGEAAIFILCIGSDSEAGI